jgi:hypothetical protein
LSFNILLVIKFRATLIVLFSLLQFLNPEIDLWLPSSANTIQEWTIRIYKAQKEVVQATLQSALSKIHLTIDLWTSPNTLAILGIVGHYISESGQLEHSILALREVSGEHTGENQSEEVLQVVKEYRFASKLGYFMMDNASNNDTLVQSVSESKYYL